MGKGDSVIAWAHKMQWLYDIDAERLPTFVFTGGILASYVEAEDFQARAAVQEKPAVRKRIEQIRGIRPIAPKWL